MLQELSLTRREDGQPDFDAVRRKYLRLLNSITNRDTILYASAFVQKPRSDAYDMGINDEDLHALMEVCARLSGSDLDLIIHSSGGSIVATEAIVSYLRDRFTNIRVIVPNLALSAAAMIACAADEIVMGKHSFLGPTDPQLPVPFGRGTVAALDVIDQAQIVRADPADHVNISALQTMLNQYGADIIRRSYQATDLSRELLGSWLAQYMFKECAGNKAEQAAKWLSSNSTLRTHGRHISRSMLIDNDLQIRLLEKDDLMQELVLSVFHATTHTFTGTRVVKIVENHIGRAYVKYESG